MVEEKGLSLSAYARHRNISPQAVSKEVQKGRLKASVRLVNGRPLITDVAAADREWDAASRRPTAVARRPTAAAAPPLRNNFWVFRAAGGVRLMYIDGEYFDAERDDLFSFTPEQARVIGRHLIDAADQAGDDPRSEKWFDGDPKDLSRANLRVPININAATTIAMIEGK